MFSCKYVTSDPYELMVKGNINLLVLLWKGMQIPGAERESALGIRQRFVEN